MKKLTIITPAYNVEKWISDLYESIKTNLKASDILNRKDFEWIIVNDQSTDRTKQMVLNWKEKWIKLINQKNSGLGAARTRGLKESSSEYIWHIDADDFIENFAFKSIEKYLNGDIEIIKVSDNHYDNQTKIIKPEPLYSYKKMKKSPHVWPQGLIIKSSIIPNNFSYFPKNGDIANFLIFDKLNWDKFKIINDRIVNYRVNIPASMSTKPSFKHIERTAQYSIEVFKKAISKNIRKAALKNAAYDYAHAIMIAKIKNEKINFEENYKNFKPHQKLILLLAKITPKWISKLIF